MANINLEMVQPPFDPYRGREPYLFVSYSHKDRLEVFLELSRLHLDGYRIWFDEGIDPGSEWPMSIQTALERCRFFLLFLSPEAVASKHVRNEINLAQKLDKPMLAVTLRRTELSSGMGLQIGDIQAIHKYSLAPERFQAKLLSALPMELKQSTDAGIADPPTSSANPSGNANGFLYEILPGGKPRSLELSRNYYTVGRAPGTTDGHFQLTDRDPSTVSRKHLCLCRLGDRWLAINLSRKYKLWVNGWQVQQRTLHHGDMLRVGKTWLYFATATDPATTPPTKPITGHWNLPAGHQGRTPLTSSPPEGTLGASGIFHRPESEKKNAKQPNKKENRKP